MRSWSPLTRKGQLEKDSSVIWNFCKEWSWISRKKLHEPQRLVSKACSLTPHQSSYFQTRGPNVLSSAGFFKSLHFVPLLQKSFHFPTFLTQWSSLYLSSHSSAAISASDWDGNQEQLSPSSDAPLLTRPSFCALFVLFLNKRCTLCSWFVFCLILFVY